MKLRDIYATEKLKNKKKGSGKFLSFVFLVTFIGIAIGAFFAYKNADKVIFYFRSDKYKELEKQLTNINKNRQKGESTDGLNAVQFQKQQEAQNKFLSLLQFSIEENPADARLFFMKGIFYAEGFLATLRKNPEIYSDFLFNEYINKNTNLIGLNETYQTKAKLAFRKALVLELSDEMTQKVNSYLGLMYFWAGKESWRESQNTIPKNINVVSGIPITDLLKIMSGNGAPTWTSLAQSFPADDIKLWQMLHYMHSGNSPIAFSIARELIHKAGNPRLGNYAAYLMGKNSRKYRSQREQLYYYQMIDLEEFLPKNPWFLSEYSTLLRFLGKQKESTRILTEYENKFKKKI